MESTLYDFIKYRRSRERTEKEDEMPCFGKMKSDIESRLQTCLGEKDKELIAEYKQVLTNILEFKNYESEIEVLYLGIKIGMEIQEAFRQMEE